MKSNHSFGLDFVIRKCKADKTKADIFARITVDGELPKEISLKEQINTISWDSVREKVKGNSIEVKAINDHIENVRFRIKEKYRELLDKHELITADSIKAGYLGTQAALKGHKLVELMLYFKKIWEPKTKEGGFKNYKTTIDYLHLFLKANYPAGDIYLSQLNKQIATDFEYYIRTNPIKGHDPCLGNGLAKHIQRFKTIINWAVDEIGWIGSNPFSSYKCPIKEANVKS